MKRINDLLPAAMAALKDQESGLILSDGKSILKEFDGYVASFAPSIITAGLKATLSFYTDNHKSQPKRVKVLRVLHSIYQNKIARLKGGDLLEMALETNDNDERQLKKDLIECSIALKLVMRNFKQVETEPQTETQNTNPPQP